MMAAELIPRSSEMEMLHERLDYLYQHYQLCAQMGCAECARFVRARQDLLSMFRVGPYIDQAEKERRVNGED